MAAGSAEPVQDVLVAGDRPRAVVFDWRGTLVTTLTPHAWVELALSSLGRPPALDTVDDLVAAIADSDGGRLDAPGVDSDSALHRATYLSVLSDAGVDSALAEALYAVESDATHNPFADDVWSTLSTLRADGIAVAVLSDIHFDVRPAFEDAGLGGLVDVFTLSFEHGTQKPEPAVYQLTVDALRVAPADTVMVGDRSAPDGAAVEMGITTLLVPPLQATDDLRLHKVLRLCGVAGSPVPGTR